MCQERGSNPKEERESVPQIHSSFSGRVSLFLYFISRERERKVERKNEVELERAHARATVGVSKCARKTA